MDLPNANSSSFEKPQKHGYILLCMDQWQWSKSQTDPPSLFGQVLDRLIDIAHSIFGPSVHLNPQENGRLILTVARESYQGFVDQCHQFRSAILDTDFQGLRTHKVLLVITSNHRGELSEEVVARLLRGRIVSELMLESQGLCMV